MRRIRPINCSEKLVRSSPPPLPRLGDAIDSGVHLSHTSGSLKVPVALNDRHLPRWPTLPSPDVPDVAREALVDLVGPAQVISRTVRSTLSVPLHCSAPLDVVLKPLTIFKTVGERSRVRI